MKDTKVFTTLFFIIAILNILGILFNITTLIFIVKPLIVLTLIYLYNIILSRVNKWYIFALISCFFGDVLLLFKDTTLFFILGLISFLIAHMFFIKIVLKRLITVSVNKILTNYIPFLILLGILLFVLKISTLEMFIPVLIYGMVITLFVTVSLVANEQRRSIKALYMLLGAIVFIVSDSLLAIDKFYYSTPVFEVIIMTTYLAAQYLIYRSMILRKKYLY